MEQTRNNGAKGFIIGGIIVLLSTLESETMIPWHIKVAGGAGLIIYGVSQLITKKKD
jgi:hypothetical protein